MNVCVIPSFKSNFYKMRFCFAIGPSSMISLKNTSTLYLKRLATTPGLLFNKFAKTFQLLFFFFFFYWIFFHEHSRFTGQQEKGEGIYLTPLYHFHPLHRHLDISRAITAESSPLHIAGSRTRTGNLWFPSASR